MHRPCRRDASVRVRAAAAAILLLVLVVACGSRTGGELAIDQPAPDERMYMMYTSGTTGNPKAVVISHGKTMAPHINVAVFARGINIHLNTRIYFEDEAAANAEDPVLNLIELEPRRATLLAKREEREGQVVYRFDIRLQGEGETVFLDV